jgi:hypothetical protein
MLSVTSKPHMLSVTLLNVIVLSVVAPLFFITDTLDEYANEFKVEKHFQLNH